MKGTQEMIAVMQAYVEGKEIEAIDANGFNIGVFNNPSWDWIRWDYRVKEEPKELTRAEITAQWVKDNDVKDGDRVFVRGRGMFNVDSILGNKILIDLGVGKDFFDVEELKKVTKKVVPFNFEDKEMFRGKWVRYKNSTHEFMIGVIYTWGVAESTGEQSPHFTYEAALEQLEFIDGNPFGKEIWE